VELDRETREGILGVEREVYKRTSTSTTRFRQKMRIEVDVLDYIKGGVLSMECKDGR